MDVSYDVGSHDRRTLGREGGREGGGRWEVGGGRWEVGMEVNWAEVKWAEVG